MRLDRWLALVVEGLAFLAYAGTLGYPLLWDDLKVLPLVRASAGEGGLSNVLALDYRQDADIPLGYYRPVAPASLLADDALGAGRAWSFHLTNVLLNVAYSVLVFFLGRSVGAASWPAAAGAIPCLMWHWSNTPGQPMRCKARRAGINRHQHYSFRL